MKVVAFGGLAVLSEHMSTTAFLIVRKSAAGMHSARTTRQPNEYTVLEKQRYKILR